MGNPMNGDGGGIEDPKDALKREILKDLDEYVDRHVDFTTGVVIEQVFDSLRAATHAANKKDKTKVDELFQRTDQLIKRLGGITATSCIEWSAEYQRQD